MTLAYIILTTVIITLLSFIGIAVLFFKEKFISRILLTLVALSAGAMLGTSFFHLLPEAIAGTSSIFTTMLIVLIGFVLFFILEQFLSWHHCHSTAHQGVEGFHCHRDLKPASNLVLYSDAVHNFIDGIIIATAFIISPALGIAAAIAVALHEVPQELGDYGVLLYGGFKRKKALILNYISASTIIVGGIVGYFLSTAVENTIMILIPFAAGSFLYIAATDLIPEIKHEEKLKDTIVHFSAFAIGIGLMIALTFIE